MSHRKHRNHRSILSDDSHENDCFIHACMNKGFHLSEVLMKASFQYTSAKGKRII